MAIKVDLNGTWKLAWRAHEDCPDVPLCDKVINARVPADVHENLIEAGLLPEPLVGANAPLHEWVENAVFTYKREFTVNVDSDFDCAELVFNGLDCLAEVFIDSDKIGSSENAFVEHVFDVTHFIQQGKTHALRVNLDTGVNWGKKQDAGKYRSCDTNMERIFLRKPQFAFKWDWAPRLVTCGIWRGVELKLYKHAALRDVLLTTLFKGTGATLQAKVNVEVFSAGDYVLKIRAANGNSVYQSTQKVSLAAGLNETNLDLTVDDVKRWYPIGLGGQALYDVTVELEKSDEAVDSYATAYGFREVIIRQDPTCEGETCFIINVNGVDVFCKGANWVPADSLFTRVTDEKYAALVEAAIDANFNMLRLWGGGFFESDTFYRLCDEHGIMIWHDFMFGCAEYPDDQEWFIENIKIETEKAIKRLRNHPSIAIWCGNNENDWIFGHHGCEGDEKNKPFFGQCIYHEVLPPICSALDPQRPYWPSSPFGGEHPNCETCGDRHAWDVSIHSKELSDRADIRNYRKDRGKFNSEYGVISYALPRTILDYTQDKQIDFNSPAYKVHDNNHNAGISETASLTDWYLKVAFGGIPKDELTYINQSLAYQAIGYREAISSFRIRKFDCAGSLFWMYSDCWGTLGWTIVDYYLRRKPSFYWVKKAYAPIAVFARPEDGCARAYVVNDTLAPVPVKLTLETGGLDGEKKSITEELIVPANGVAQSSEILCGPGYALAYIEKDGAIHSEDLTLTHFPSEMKIPDVNITADFKQVGNALDVTVSSDGFGHFVYLDLPDSAEVSDNYFNLLPDRPKVVRVTGATPDEIKIDALNIKRG